MLILAAGCWIFRPALHGDWLWEDDLYLTDNPLLNDPSALWKIWFAPGSFIEYYPIEQTVQWTQWQLWHNETFGYHVTNLVLHLTNALLVWRLLSKFGLRLAWLGGLIFAIHPVVVDSVAWITEFKNTLSLAPFLLAMGFYLDYEERGSKRDYLLALGFFLVAMLCKITMAPFPVVMLLVAWWKRGRIRWRDGLAAAPFFVISVTLGLITIWTGNLYRESNLQPPDVVPMGGFFSRLALGGLSIAFYFFKTIWPVELMPIYPHWKIDPPSLVQFLPWPVILGVIYWLWTKRASWGRHVLLGLGFFLIMLGPFIGFHAISYMGFTWVMDHILYIPMLGLIGLTVAGLERIDARLSPPLQRCGIGLVAVLLALMAWESHAYAKKFVSEDALWGYAVAHNPESWFARYNLGEALVLRGQIPDAMEQYEQALQGNPNLALAHNNLGLLLLNQGHVPEARQHLETALRIYPDYPEAHDNMGLLLFQTGHASDAIAEYQQAVRLKPLFDQAYNNLGNALAQSGHLSEAMDQYAHALAINPRDSKPHNNMGLLLMQSGRGAEAIDQFELALAINPQLADTRSNLGIALYRAGRVQDAADQFTAAVQIDPNYAEAHNNLGIAFARMGRASDAAEQFSAALRLNPQFPGALANLKQLQSEQKKTPAKP